MPVRWTLGIALESGVAGQIVEHHETGPRPLSSTQTDIDVFSLALGPLPAHGQRHMFSLAFCFIPVLTRLTESSSSAKAHHFGFLLW